MLLVTLRYRLAYECAGHGTPAVILEAGYTASGIDTYGPVIVPALARRTRVCTYDRAGDGLSDARPASVWPLTGATQAAELHTLLHVIGVGPPYVLVGHSYGGMITREFAARYRGEVAGMVLIDASSEPEVVVYDRLHAGPWIDGTVQPAPNQRVNIHATVRQLERAPRLGPMPLIVITATQAVLAAAARHTALAACPQVFGSAATAECLGRGHLGRQQT